MKFDLSSFNRDSIKKGINFVKNRGLPGVMSRVRYKMSEIGGQYDDWYRLKHEEDEDLLARQRESALSYAPCMSILVSVYMTPEKYLREMIESVIAQTYANWELLLVDGSYANDVAEEFIYVGEAERIIKLYMEREPRIRYKRQDKNPGISANLNAALSAATGEYVVMLDHDDVLPPEALYLMAEQLQETRHDVLYSDSDKLAEDGRKYMDPDFKPDFSWELLRACNYIDQLLVVKKSLALAVGGFHSEYDGAQDYDFTLRCCERTKDICHVPRVLYHWRVNGASSVAGEHKKEYAMEMGKKALAAHLVRMKIMGTVNHTEISGMYKVLYETPGNPQISVVIAGPEDKELVRKCILPLYELARYSNFELLVVDPGDHPEITEYFRKLELRRRNVRLLDYKGERTVSGLRNFGAARAKGDYIMFLDPNVEIIDATAVGEMLGLCMAGGAGLVGGTLYNDRNNIYSEGMAVGVAGGCAHLYAGLKKGDYGYLMRNRVNGNYSAVSCACVLMAKQTFRVIGGFSEKFKTELADADFCLRAGEHGFSVACAADAGWYYHRKGQSLADAGKSADELLKERHREEDLFAVLWAHVIGRGDPYYNINFSRDDARFSLS